jgi:hypothetical protein
MYFLCVLYDFELRMKGVGLIIFEKDLDMLFVDGIKLIFIIKYIVLMIILSLILKSYLHPIHIALLLLQQTDVIYQVYRTLLGLENVLLFHLLIQILIVRLLVYHSLIFVTKN